MAEEGAAASGPEQDPPPHSDDTRCGSRVVPRQPRPARTDPDDLLDLGHPTGGCQTRLAGWAGAHLHGAVRPRRGKTVRGRPPRRWC